MRRRPASLPLALALACGGCGGDPPGAPDLAHLHDLLLPRPSDGGPITAAEDLSVLDLQSPDLLPLVPRNCDGTPIGPDGAVDPFLRLQWHLGGGQTDLHLGNLWPGERGQQVLVAVVDDGLEIEHDDLKTNVLPRAGLNFFVGDLGFSPLGDDPSPQNPPRSPQSPPAHGTAVGGVIAARDHNGLGVAGVAPRACLVGMNLIATGGNTAVQDAQAMVHRVTEVGASNNSWGSTDRLGTVDGSSQEWRDAVEQGLATGRGGRGTLYLWAAGNGARGSEAKQTGVETDNSNYDGQANFHGVVAVAALGEQGKRLPYSERGANLWVAALAETAGYDQDHRGITTTDVSGVQGYNGRQVNLDPKDVAVQMRDYTNGDYTQGFNGTSAATPMVAGVVALMIHANPRLTHRDLRLILAETARKNDPGDGGWQRNAGRRTDGNVGYAINHQYGFGLVDAEAAVNAARTWPSLGPALLPYDSGPRAVGRDFADQDAMGAGDAVTVMGSLIERLEFVEVELTAGGDLGDLEVRLEGSAGTTSLLAEPHDCYADAEAMTPKASCQMAYTGWRFGSARHLGESANQTWTLTVADRRPGRSLGGRLIAWRLTLRGRAK